MVLAILVPFLVYLSAKLGAFGALRGREAFEEYQRRKKDGGG